MEAVAEQGLLSLLPPRLTVMLPQRYLNATPMARPVFYKTVLMVGVDGSLQDHLNLFKNRAPAIFGRSLLWYEGTFGAMLMKHGSGVATAG